LAGDSDRLVNRVLEELADSAGAAMALTPPSAKAISPAIARVEGSLNARSLPASAAAGACLNARLCAGVLYFADLLSGSFVHWWPQRGIDFRHHSWPRNVQRLVQVHDETDRPAGNQRQVDCLPIIIGGIFDDGPALENGGFFSVNSRR